MVAPTEVTTKCYNGLDEYTTAYWTCLKSVKICYVSGSSGMFRNKKDLLGTFLFEEATIIAVIITHLRLNLYKAKREIIQKIFPQPLYVKFLI